MQVTTIQYTKRQHMTNQSNTLQNNPLKYKAKRGEIDVYQYNRITYITMVHRGTDLCDYSQGTLES